MLNDPAPSVPPESLAKSLPPPPDVGPSSAQGGSVSPSEPPPPVPKDRLPASGSDGRLNKANPLTNLIETERVYIDQLGGIVRTVASAWTRRHKPPPELDQMFRRVEAIFKVNHIFLGKLKKDIGSNPSNLRILGDVLLQWVKDMQDPYAAYCSQLVTGFDTWDPAQSNSRLAPALAALSEAVPPPQDPANPDRPGLPTWTLDNLFLLPRDRLRYYRKLYNRLRKNSDNSSDSMLRTAVDALDNLMQTAEARLQVKLESPAPSEQVPFTSNETTDEVVLDMRQPAVPDEVVSTVSVVDRLEEQANFESSEPSPPAYAPKPAQEPLSKTVYTTADLEKIVLPSRCIDLFTMKPRQVSLALNPPTLPFTRVLRFSSDVLIRFVPTSTSTEVVHEKGCIFLLTDLLLICEKMAPNDEEQSGNEGGKFWLLYPPLAARHLRVTAFQESAIELTILKKETMRLVATSSNFRDSVLHEFQSCISAAQSLPTASKQAPPPVPTLSAQNGLSIVPPPSNQFLQSRSPSPIDAGRPPRQPRPSDGLFGHPTEGPIHNSGSMASLHQQPEVQRQSSLPPRSPGGIPGPGPSFGVGQIIPSPREDSRQQPQFPYRPPGAAAPARPPFPNMENPMLPHKQITMPPPRSDSMPRSPMAGPTHSLSHPPSLQDLRSQMSPGPGPNSLMQQQHGQGYPGPPDMRNQQMQGFPPRPGMMQQPPPGFLPPGASGGPGFGPGPGFNPGYPNPAGQPGMYNGGPGMRNPQFSPPPNDRAVRSPSNSTLSSFDRPQSRPMLPSATVNSRIYSSMPSTPSQELSPPGSPTEAEPPINVPVVSTISATMPCKLFIKQHHSQWKALGSAKLTLYVQDPTNVKQLVVEQDNKDKTVLVSTVILSSGVERVGKTGVAIELSDAGARTGIIYMIQVRNEKVAQQLFDRLLAGSDRNR